MIRKITYSLESCVFCRIVKKEMPADFIFENDSVIAIFDRNPLSNGHALIITKMHYKNLSTIDHLSWNEIFPVFVNLIKHIQEKYSPKGFNFISNIGEEAYQSIMHLHIHLIPKYNKEDGFVWPNNKY